MLPNIHIHEQLMKQHLQELQHERAQQRLAARLRRHRSSLPRRLASAVGARLLALWVRMKRLEMRGEPAMQEQSSPQ